MEEGTRGGELGEVAVAAGDQMPVVDVEEGGQRVAADLVERVRGSKEPGIEGDDRQDRQQRRKEAADAMAPEPQQPDATMLTELRHQEPRDQKAGEDEEHVDSEESPRSPRQPPVEADDQRDAEGSNAIERRDANHVRLRILALRLFGNLRRQGHGCHQPMLRGFLDLMI